MNQALKNRVLVWSVVLLMIANVAVLATIWYMHKGPGRQEQRETPAAFLIRELSLDKKQQQQFEQLRKDHQDQSFKLRGEIKDARDRFFKLLQQPNISDSEKNAASAEVGKHLQALDMLTFDHFKSLRAICTPAQQQKFDEIIEEVLRMMAGPPPPPNGRPPMNGHPPGDNMPPPPQDH